MAWSMPWPSRTLTGSCDTNIFRRHPPAQWDRNPHPVDDQHDLARQAGHRYPAPSSTSSAPRLIRRSMPPTSDRLQTDLNVDRHRRHAGEGRCDDRPVPDLLHAAHRRPGQRRLHIPPPQWLDQLAGRGQDPSRRIGRLRSWKTPMAPTGGLTREFTGRTVVVQFQRGRARNTINQDLGPDLPQGGLRQTTALIVTT